VHVSLWDSDEQANRMSRLNEMIVSARSHAEGVEVANGCLIRDFFLSILVIYIDPLT
jgi:hypothetical protein